MRTGMIASAVLTLGLAAVPSMAQARPAPESRVDTRTVTQEARPVEVQQVNRTAKRTVNVVRDEHRDIRVNVIPQRDVHIDEHVVVERGDRHWDHDRVYIPAPVIVAVPVDPYFDTPVGIDQVPPVVLNAAAQQSGGAPIVSIDYLHNPAGTFYDVHVAGPYNTIRTLRFGLFGGFYGCV